MNRCSLCGGAGTEYHSLEAVQAVCYQQGSWQAVPQSDNFRYTDVLVLDHLKEWPRVLYSDVCWRCCAGGMSTRSYTIRYIMTTLALLRLTSSGIKFSCCIIAATLLFLKISLVTKPGYPTLNCLYLPDASLPGSAPYSLSIL